VEAEHAVHAFKTAIRTDAERFFDFFLFLSWVGVFPLSGRERRRRARSWPSFECTPEFTRLERFCSIVSGRCVCARSRLAG
jgi:hypothetical protein